MNDLEISEKTTTENVGLKGYEVLIQWMLVLWARLSQRIYVAMQRLDVDSTVAGAQLMLLAGQREYPPSIPVLMTGSLQQRLMPRRHERRSEQLWNVAGRELLYPDDLLRFQGKRLTVS